MNADLYVKSPQLKLFLITPNDAFAEYQGVQAHDLDILVWAADAAQAVRLAAKAWQCEQTTFDKDEDGNPGTHWTVRELPSSSSKAGEVEWSECAFTFWEAK